MSVANTDIREKAKAAGVKLWQIVAACGMHDSNFSKLLRFELSNEKKNEITAIIDNLQKGA